MKNTEIKDISANMFLPGLIVVNPGDVSEPDSEYNGFVRDYRFEPLARSAIETNLDNIMAYRESRTKQLIARLFILSADFDRLSDQELEIARDLMKVVENNTLAEWVAGILNSTLPISSESSSAARFRSDLSSMELEEVPARVEHFHANGYDYVAYKKSLSTNK